MALPEDHTDRAALIRAFEAGRAAGDVAAMAGAALALAAHQQFGTHLGRTPAYLHQAYSLASGVERVRLATALARTWVYGGEPARAAPFAFEAVAAASQLADPELLAGALDAELLAHWGPDDLAERLRITSRLEDTVAHVADVEARMTSHLWRLTTALESLDTVTIQRQLRALDDLADESGSLRVRFFAQSRRAMHALLVGDLTAARALVEATVRAGEAACEADTEALLHELTAQLARQSGDQSELTTQAEAFEEFGMGQGVPSIAAEGATLWLAAGSVDRARALLQRLAGAGLAAIPRDVDWLITLASLTEVAAATGERELAAEAVRLLSPYAGRAVVNAGAVTFVGVVDEYLHRACVALGRDDDAARWIRAAAACYSRIGAAWWSRRLNIPAPLDRSPAVAHLAPAAGGVWIIGSAGVPVREVKGFRYLRLLLERPGAQLSALELSAAVEGRSAAVDGRAAAVDSSLGEVLDRQALSAYRRRLQELEEELTQARAWADEARLARIAAERGMLLDEVASATGLSGRRRYAGATSERARVAVQKSLAAAIKRIGEVDPAIGRLLRDTVRTGTMCCYETDPSRPVRWQLSS